MVYLMGEEVKFIQMEYFMKEIIRMAKSMGLVSLFSQININIRENSKMDYFMGKVLKNIIMVMYMTVTFNSEMSMVKEK